MANLDDAVREIHGVKTIIGGRNSERIVLREQEGTIFVDMGTGSAGMTIWQARYLARKLYHLARRIEARKIFAEDTNEGK